MCKPESSSCSSISMMWGRVVESAPLFFLQASLWPGESGAPSSESLPHCIWTSGGFCCSLRQFVFSFVTTSLRATEAEWWKPNRLLWPGSRHPAFPPPFPCCFVRLLDTLASIFEPSESSELPSYGSKHCNHNKHTDVYSWAQRETMHFSSING